MSLFTRLLMVIYFCCIYSCTGRHGEFISKQDRSYEVIHFKVPRTIWNQAFVPTPVLKSPITIVVPINVDPEQENEIEEVEDDVIEDPVSDTPITEIPIQEDPAITVASIATQAPVLPEQVPNDQVPNDQVPVEGQVTRFPCTCIDGQCGCCTGAIMDRLRMKACGNIKFVPEDFVFDVRLTVNNNTVVRRRVSASDPPPICFNPRRAPFIRVCAKISNIRIRNGNAFACLDITADIANFPIYSASFRCFGLGSSGLQTGLKPKPVSSGPKPVSLFGSGNNNEGTILDAAGELIANNGNGLLPQGGLFGRPGGLFGGDGPLDAIGDAVGELFGA